MENWFSISGLYLGPYHKDPEFAPHNFSKRYFLG